MSIQFENLSSFLPMTDVQESLNNASNTERTEELRKACKDFESLFIAQLLKTMRSSIEKSGLFEEDMGSEIYQSMFDLEVSNKIADGGGFGLADMLLAKLSAKLSEIDKSGQPLAFNAENNL